MPSHQKPTFNPPANPSQEGTSEWYYNEIMRHIEPDLLTTVIPTHAKKYAKESPEQSLERMKAYDIAFAVFDKAATDVAQEYKAGVQKMREEAKTKVKSEERKEQMQSKEQLKNIEDQFRGA